MLSYTTLAGSLELNKMNKKILTLGYWIVLLSVIVIAAAPTVPNLLTPVNESTFMKNNLVCSGSTDGDGDDINYILWYHYNSTYNILLENDTTTDYEWFSPYSEDEWKYSSTGNYRVLESDSDIVMTAFTTASMNATNDFTFNSNFWPVRYWGDIGTKKIWIDGYEVYSENAMYNSLISMINVTNFTDGNSHEVIFEFQSAGTNEQLHIWPYVYDNSTILCQAQDDNGEYSTNLTHQYTLPNFRYCNSTVTSQSLIITFEGENNTGTKINGTLDNFNLVLDAGANDLSNSYGYQLDNNNEFGFCMNPSGVDLSTSGTTISYSYTGYPQRQITFNDNLNSSSEYDLTLYLLPENDGIYSTVQVVDANTRNPISGATVIGQKQLGGDWTTVTSGLTDAAGTATFWVDPNSQHQFLFSATGYVDVTSVITPTQSVYTQTLQTSGDSNYTNPYEGMIWNVLPSDAVLGQNTVYNFAFNITSSYWNLTNFGFDIFNSTGENVLSKINSTSTSGGYLNNTLGTNGHSRLTMYYYWTIDDGSVINGTQFWGVRNVTQGAASLAVFFDNLKTYDAGGADDFTKALTYLFLMVIVISTLIFFVGDTGLVEYSVLIGIAAMTWLGEWAQLIPSLGTQYLISIIISLMVGGYLINDNIR